MLWSHPPNWLHLQAFHGWTNHLLVFNCWFNKTSNLNGWPLVLVRFRHQNYLVRFRRRCKTRSPEGKSCKWPNQPTSCPLTPDSSHSSFYWGTRGALWRYWKLNLNSWFGMKQLIFTAHYLSGKINHKCWPWKKLITTQTVIFLLRWWPLVVVVIITAAKEDARWSKEQSELF